MERGNCSQMLYVHRERGVISSSRKWVLGKVPKALSCTFSGAVQLWPRLCVLFFDWDSMLMSSSTSLRVSVMHRSRVSIQRHHLGGGSSYSTCMMRKNAKFLMSRAEIFLSMTFGVWYVVYDER